MDNNTSFSFMLVLLLILLLAIFGYAFLTQSHSRDLVGECIESGQNPITCKCTYFDCMDRLDVLITVIETNK